MSLSRPVAIGASLAAFDDEQEARAFTRTQVQRVFGLDERVRALRDREQIEIRFDTPADSDFGRIVVEHTPSGHRSVVTPMLSTRRVSELIGSAVLSEQAFRAQWLAEWERVPEPHEWWLTWQ